MRYHSLIISLAFFMVILYVANTCKKTINKNLLSDARLITWDSPYYPTFESYSRKDNYSGIQYVGNWVHMTGGGSFNKIQNSLNDTIIYRFWGFGIDIKTEFSSTHKGYQLFIDGNPVQNISTFTNGKFTKDSLSYRNWNLNTGNHVLKMVPNGGYFVLDEFEVFYWPNPLGQKSDCLDTLIIEKIDTLIIEKIDTLTIEKIDTLFIQKDCSEIITKYNNWIDSLQLVIDNCQSKPKDTIKLLPKITIEF